MYQAHQAVIIALLIHTEQATPVRVNQTQCKGEALMLKSEHLPPNHHDRLTLTHIL